MPAPDISTLALTSRDTERNTSDRTNGAADELARLQLAGSELARGGSILLDAGEDIGVAGPTVADFDVALRAIGAITAQTITAGDDLAMVAGTAINTARLPPVSASARSVTGRTAWRTSSPAPPCWTGTPVRMRT
jgi:hypothetical protein